MRFPALLEMGRMQQKMTQRLKGLQAYREENKSFPAVRLEKFLYCIQEER